MIANISQPFLLVLHGPICGGKTHFARHLGKQARLFVVGNDKVKWCISDYSMKKYGGTGIVNTLMFRLIEVAVGLDFSVVVEGNLRLRSERLGDIAELCRQRDLRFVEVNIEAPVEVLEDRFRKRRKRSTKAGIRLAEKNIANVAKRHQRYLAGHDPDLLTLDSSSLSLDEMTRRVAALLTQ